MSSDLLSLERYEQAILRSSATVDSGKVNEVSGLLIKGYLPGATIGSVVRITPTTGHSPIYSEVVGVKERQILMMPLGEMAGIGLGARLELIRQMATVKVGKRLLGRVINAEGLPIDGKGELTELTEVPVYHHVCNPLQRRPIHEPLDLGVRAIDGCLTVGQGQRMAILAGSGVGKSVLLGMLAKNSKADVNVIALIGERGREVRDFIENELGEEGLAKSVVIAATGDETPLVRMRGAYVASSIAEYFAERGSNVLLTMDSITRFSMAQREIGLSAGEPPATKGYTPSVFAKLPKILERAGNFEGKGSITGLYTVLVEGDDFDDPIADAVRSIVDGHIVLSRKMAQSGHFPAIDILQSSSRVMNACVSEKHKQAAMALRQLLATYRDAEDMINIGAYQRGGSTKIDQAIDYYDHINQFLRQETNEVTSFAESMNHLLHMFGLAEG